MAMGTGTIPLRFTVSKYETWIKVDYGYNTANFGNEGPKALQEFRDNDEKDREA